MTNALVEVAMSLVDVVVLGDTTRRVPHIVNLAVGGVLAEAVLLGLDRSGVAAHSGSACSSESIEPSPVLAAMKVDPDRSLRLSVGWSTTDADVEAFAAAFRPVVERLRAALLGRPHTVVINVPYRRDDARPPAAPEEQPAGTLVAADNGRPH